jgi:hypothetical protein
MSDESLVVDSDAVSMDDLLAAFAADPLVDGEDGEPSISDIKKAVMRESKKFRRNKAKKAVQQMVELSSISCLDEDDSSAIERSSLSELPSTRDFNEYFLQDFFGSDGEIGPADNHEITHSRSVELKISNIPKETHLQEIDRLKSLVLEAQETIIKLLTDRVDDKAKLATLEAQVKFLPLQHLGDANAIQLRNEQESLRIQLSEIRHEVQKTEIGKIRHSMNWEKPKPKSSLLARFFGRS